MASGLASDEVAEDYKNSLEDLTLNSRYEIGNLTVIAKENVDHALAISRVVENHIRNAPPSRKLPALYVLDSVVKNVGTPYTLFFGRNLYQTFMNAYTLVDSPVRKKLEEMLKTWKEPVPGSLDSRPVFPPDITRPIENALIKARTAAIQLQQQQAKSLQGRAATGWKSAPTPPPGTSGPRYSQTPVPAAVPPYLGYQQQGYNQRPVTRPAVTLEPTPVSSFTANGAQAFSYPQHPTPPPALAPYSPPDAFPAPSDGIEALNNDLAELIAGARADFAGNPYDQSLQQRLKALLDLQSILRSQHLPPDHLKLIRNQVAQLSAVNPPTPTLPPERPYSPPPAAPPVPAPLQELVVSAPPPVQPSIQALLPPNALAALLASVNSNQTPKPPTPQPSLPAAQPPAPFSLPQSIPPVIASASQPPGESPLIASLRAAGMLPPTTSGQTASTTHAPAPSAVAPTLSPLTPFLPQVHSPASATPVQSNQKRRPLVDVPNDVQLTSASLRTLRPELISALYEAQPNQCGTCGRRFLATEDGRRKKASHLDWHFRVNIRMADAVKRGQNRSWYVDEMEWIKSRDDDEGSGREGGAGGLPSVGTENGTAARGKAQPKQQWVPVPNEPALANSACPICQERFETVWHDEAQEWVWMDAVKIKGRVYHASCHAEASKDGTSTPSRNMTPDPPPILGKRKAEENETMPLRGKVKKEFAT